MLLLYYYLFRNIRTTITDGSQLLYSRTTQNDKYASIEKLEFTLDIQKINLDTVSVLYPDTYLLFLW